jgi:anti-sigma-K factor RskA
MTGNDRMARAENYVFGLMDEHERERAERDMAVDPEFRECVTLLADRLRQLHRAKGAAPMSDADWHHVTQNIVQLPQMHRKDSEVPLSVMETRVPPPDTKGLLGLKRPAPQQFSGWRGTVVAIVLVAALLVGWFAGQTTARVPSPVTVALLKDDAGAPGIVIETYANQNVRFLPLTAIEIPEGTVLQLWCWQGDVAIPIGATNLAEAMTIQGPDLPAPTAGQIFSITREKFPGSATGRPAADTVFSGAAFALAR